MCAPVVQRLRWRPSNCNSLLHVSLSLSLHISCPSLQLSNKANKRFHSFEGKSPEKSYSLFKEQTNHLQHNISHHGPHTFCLSHTARKSIMLCTSGSPIFQENECEASLQCVWFQGLNRYFTIGIDNSINKMSVDVADTLYTILYLESGALEYIWLPLMVAMGGLQSLFFF